MHSIFCKGLYAFVLFSTLFLQVAAAQTIAAEEPLRLAVDYARFRGDEKSVYVEVYYSIPQRSITYKADDSGWSGGIELTMVVMRKDSVVYADRWFVPHTVKDSGGIAAGMNLVGLTNAALPEGEYNLAMIGRDKHSPSRRDSVSMRLPLKLFADEKVAISDIELASNIKQQGNKSSPFYKNTLEIVPSPDGLFGEDQRCYFYAEAYNLLVNGDRGPYYTKTVVLDAIGREVISRERSKKRTGESSVIVENILTDQLNTGSYSLILGLMDSSKKVIASVGRRFIVVNKKLGIDTTLQTGPRLGSLGEYAGIEEPELDREFDLARHESNYAEKQQFKALTGADAKRKFLAEFWQRRPLGFKQEYLKRVGIANSTFSILGREGYWTDRGRVYIVYGPPDNIDRHPNEPGYRPYEVWTFNSIQGGVMFAFVQRASGGDYELMHSTHRNELHDANWMQNEARIR